MAADQWRVDGLAGGVGVAARGMLRIVELRLFRAARGGDLRGHGIPTVVGAEIAFDFIAGRRGGRCGG